MAAVSGFGGRVIVANPNDDSIVMPAGRWQVIGTAQLVPITTVASGDVNEYLAGYEDYEATVDCFWDQGVQAFTLDPPYIRPGTLIQLFLYFNRPHLQSAFVFRNFLIATVTCDEELRNVFKYTFSGRQSSSGTFTSETGGVTFPGNN